MSSQRSEDVNSQRRNRGLLWNMRVNAAITGQLKIQQKAQKETWKKKQLKKLIVQKLNKYNKIYIRKLYWLKCSSF